MTQTGHSAGLLDEVPTMMGMGFLRLNRMLAKHKWDTEEGVENEEQDRRKRKLFVLALIIVLVSLGIVIYFYW